MELFFTNLSDVLDEAGNLYCYETIGMPEQWGDTTEVVGTIREDDAALDESGPGACVECSMVTTRVLCPENCRTCVECTTEVCRVCEPADSWRPVVALAKPVAAPTDRGICRTIPACIQRQLEADAAAAASSDRVESLNAVAEASADLFEVRRQALAAVRAARAGGPPRGAA